MRKEIQENSGKAEKNVEKLLKLSKTKVESKVADKVKNSYNFVLTIVTFLVSQLLQRARTGKYVLDSKKPQEESSNQESLFTEDDFAMFEKEYIV